MFKSFKNIFLKKKKRKYGFEDNVAVFSVFFVQKVFLFFVINIMILETTDFSRIVENSF